MLNFLKRNLKYVIMVVILIIIFILSRYDSYQSTQTASFYNDFSPYPMLIIDSGHGGLDGGAVAANGFAESEATLSIGLKAKNICDFLGIKNVMTRYDEGSLDFDESKGIRENKVSDTRARVELVNSFDDGVLVSVHLNNFTDTSVYGAQVFYNKDGQELAEILQNNVRNFLDITNERTILPAPETVYLISNSNNPSIIFECGFLSNETEVALLCDSNYQTKLALTMVCSYIDYANQNESKDIGV